MALVILHNAQPKGLGKTANDASLVATMNVSRITSILTFNRPDFKRYGGIQVIHPSECAP